MKWGANEKKQGLSGMWAFLWMDEQEKIFWERFFRQIYREVSFSWIMLSLLQGWDRVIEPELNSLSPDEWNHWMCPNEEGSRTTQNSGFFVKSSI